MEGDIPKSHLLITQILRNFNEKTNELNRLRKRIDQVYANLHRENVAGKLDLGNFDCDPTLDEISTKKLAICVIGQSYEAKIRVVNDIFALKNRNVLEPTTSLRPSRRNSTATIPPTSLRRASIPDVIDAGESGLTQNRIPNEEDIFDISGLFGDNETGNGSIRRRLGSEGRMVQLVHSDYGIDTTDRIGSFHLVKVHAPQRPRLERSNSERPRSSLVGKVQLGKKVTSKDDCCDVSFSHPLLSNANIIVSPSMPELFNSDDIIDTLTRRCIPFFVYAVDRIPFNEKELEELNDLKKRLPLAAVMFVKVECNWETYNKDFASLHGADKRRQTCEHIRDSKTEIQRNSPILGTPNTCFTCSLHNSNFLQQLKDIDLLGTGDWQCRSNRGMFLESSKKLHDLIVPFIRRQSRAYLLAAITGMQSYLHDVMSKLVSFCFDLKKDSILLPSRIQYVDEKVNLIKNSRLAVSRNRIFETLMMIISKLKIDLMDQTSSMYKAIDELDQSSNLHEAYEQIECFVMGRVKNLIFIEMASVLTPFDSKPLVRLLEKLQTNVKSTRKYDRIYVSKDQPTYLLKEFIQNPLNEQTFKIQSGLTFSYRGKISRSFRMQNPSLLSMFSAGDKDFRFRYCSDIISQISPSILAKKIHIDLLEKTAYDFEYFTSQFIILEQRLMRFVDDQMNKKNFLQRNKTPNVARLLLEVTAFRDAIINGMPKLGKEIGRGQYGVVFSTTSDWERRNKNMEIAIKSMIPENDRHWGDLSQEYFYMHYWIGKHPNVVQIMGVIIDCSYGPGNGLTPSVLLILEKCESDLHTALKNGKLHSLKKRVRIAADIAAGLRYLHSFGLIHRDIKLKNILLNQQHNAKISDMGFCRPSAVTEGSIVGTPIHMPPEIFAGNYDQSVDIYAFGILLWYLLRNSCRLPTNFEYCIDKEMLWREVLKGIRPEKISGVNRK